MAKKKEQAQIKKIKAKQRAERERLIEEVRKKETHKAKEDIKKEEHKKIEAEKLAAEAKKKADKAKNEAESAMRKANAKVVIKHKPEPLTVNHTINPLSMVLTAGDTMNFAASGLVPGLAAQTFSERLNPITADLVSEASLHDSALF